MKYKIKVFKKYKVKINLYKIIRIDHNKTENKKNQLKKKILIKRIT